MKQVLLVVLTILFGLPSMAAAEPCGGCWGMMAASPAPTPIVPNK